MRSIDQYMEKPKHICKNFPIYTIYIVYTTGSLKNYKNCSSINFPDTKYQKSVYFI